MCKPGCRHYDLWTSENENGLTKKRVYVPVCVCNIIIKETMAISKQWQSVNFLELQRTARGFCLYLEPYLYYEIMPAK